MLNKIADILNDFQEKNKVRSSGQKNESANNGNILKEFVPKGEAIGNKEQIVDIISNALKEYKFDETLKIPAITIYISDSGFDELIKGIVTATGFEKELKLKLSHKRIYAATNDNCKWYFIFEKPQEGAREIVKGIYLLQKQQEEKAMVDFQKAKITALKGSIEQDTYLLNSEKQTKWNIGRRDDDKPYQNQIVINNIKDKNDPVYQINGRVSRKHACIIFVPNEGYKLKTYKNWNNPNNTYILANTSIVREDEESNFTDEEQVFLLQNDDKIILNDSVCLLFEFVKPEEQEMVDNTQSIISAANGFVENDLGI